MRDLRLYRYGYGQLYKVGTRKDTHKFTDLKSTKERIKFLKNRNVIYQFVIIEYFTTHDSKIIEII